MTRQSQGVLSLMLGLFYLILTMFIQIQSVIEFNILVFGLLSLITIWATLSFICKLNMVIGLKNPIINKYAGIFFSIILVLGSISYLLLGLALSSLNITTPINLSALGSYLLLSIGEISFFIYWGVIDALDYDLQTKKA